MTVQLRWVVEKRRPDGYWQVLMARDGTHKTYDDQISAQAEMHQLVARNPNQRYRAVQRRVEMPDHE